MPDDLTTRYPNAYQAWVAAGGVQDSFRRHLVLTGQMPSTQSDLLDIMAMQITGFGQAMALYCTAPK